MKIYLWSEFQNEIWNIPPIMGKTDRKYWFPTKDNEMVEFIQTFGKEIDDPTLAGKVWELDLDE